MFVKINYVEYFVIIKKMILFKKHLKRNIIAILVLVVCIFFGIYGYKKHNKKSFESELDKNKLERCLLREKNNCNSKRERCMLYDEKSKDDCESEFNSCIQQVKKQKC